MVKISSFHESKKIDEYLLENKKYSIVDLVSRAGRTLYKISKGEYDFKKPLVISYLGNNGADGLAFAYNCDCDVRVYIPVKKELFLDKASESCKYFYEKIIVQNKKVFFEDEIKLEKLIDDSDLIIDSLFGVGLDKKISGNSFLTTINKINDAHKNGKTVVSCDVPSGVLEKEDNEGVYVHCDLLVTFLTFKMVLLNEKYIDSFDRVKISNLEFKEKEIVKIENSIFKKDTLNYINKITFPKRIKNTSKFDYGKAYIFAGGDEYTSNIIMPSLAAINSGAGYVYSIVEKYNSDLAKLAPEIIQINFGKALKDLKSNNYNNKVIGFGMGMGNNVNTKEQLTKILNETNCKILLDADGLNVVDKKHLPLLRKRSIITPHIYEFAKLIDEDVETINKNKIHYAKYFAKKHEIIVVLKGYNSIITDGEEVFINSTGNAYMGIAGSGDVLSGLITSFLAQTDKLLNAAKFGVYIHGLTGDLIETKEHPVRPMRIIEEIPKIIKKNSQ